MPKRRFNPEMIRTVPIRYVKTGDTLIILDTEVKVEAVEAVSDHFTVTYKGRPHYYGKSSKVKRLENPI